MKKTASLPPIDRKSYKWWNSATAAEMGLGLKGKARKKFAEELNERTTAALEGLKKLFKDCKLNPSGETITVTWYFCPFCKEVFYTQAERDSHLKKCKLNKKRRKK